MRNLALLLLSLGGIYNSKANSGDKPKIQKNSISYSNQPWATLQYSGEESPILISSFSSPIEPCTFVSSTGFCDTVNCYNIQVNYPTGCSSVILPGSVSSQTFVDEAQEISKIIPQVCHVTPDSYSKPSSTIVFKALYTEIDSKASNSVPLEMCYALTITAEKNSPLSSTELQCIINNYAPPIKKYGDDLEKCQNKIGLDYVLLVLIPSIFLVLGCCLTHKNYPRIKNSCSRLALTIQSSGLWRKRRNSNAITPNDASIQEAKLLLSPPPTANILPEKRFSLTP